MFFNFFYIFLNYKLNKTLLTSTSDYTLKKTMTIKKLIIKALNVYINKNNNKLQDLLQKETTTEKQVTSIVKNLLVAHQHLRKVKFEDDYEFIEKNNKLYYTINGHRLFLMNTSTKKAFPDDLKDFQTKDKETTIKKKKVA